MGGYPRQVPDTLAPWGAELLLRGRRVASSPGESPIRTSSSSRFPSAAAAGGWFASPAYQAPGIPLREQAADVLLLAYEELAAGAFRTGLTGGQGAPVKGLGVPAGVGFRLSSPPMSAFAATFSDALSLLAHFDHRCSRSSRCRCRSAARRWCSAR